MPVPKPGIDKEKDLLAPVSRYAKRKGFTLQCAELPFFDYRIDLYALSKPTGYTIAIELKIKNWRRALHQALIYQLCSDYVYIAVPLDNARLVSMEELAKHGIGLIAVGPDKRCRMNLDAVKSSEVREYYRRPYIDYLASVPDA